MNDWIAIEIYHERYCFNTDVAYHVDKTLEEVCDYHGFNYSNLKKYDERGYCYLADDCRHDNYDIINENMIRYSIHALLIIDAHYLWETAIKDGKEFEIPFLFGNTNKKFGLVDFRK